MHLVVVVARPEPLDQAVARLASCAAITPYEARTRLAGDGVPRVVSTLADGAAAADLSTRLAAVGFGAQVLAAREIPHDEDRDRVASLAFGDDALEASMRDGSSRVVPYASIALVLHGARTITTSRTIEETSKKFSPGRALLTGGLVLRASTTTTRTEATGRRETFAYVYQHGEAPLAFYERGVNYAFLGARLTPSSLANFTTVLGEIRRRAPEAPFDDRLTRAVGLGALPLPPPAMDAGEWKSDVSAAVLALALAR